MPIVCGDTKKGWPIFEALDFIREHPDGYDEVPNNYLARPFEQMQQYCLTYNTPYAFVCTKLYLILLEFTLSSDAHQSPRPIRTTQTHNRILSTSTKASTELTSNFSEMSFEPSPVDRNVGLVKVGVIPWNAQKGELTSKLALWCLIMHARYHNGLQQSYDPLDGSVAMGQSQPSPRSERISGTKGKGKAPADTQSEGSRSSHTHYKKVNAAIYQQDGQLKTVFKFNKVTERILLNDCVTRADHPNVYFYIII
jgi:hypothetical protein